MSYEISSMDHTTCSMDHRTCSCRPPTSLRVLHSRFSCDGHEFATPITVSACDHQKPISFLNFFKKKNYCIRRLAHSPRKINTPMAFLDMRPSKTHQFLTLFKNKDSDVWAVLHSLRILHTRIISSISRISRISRISGILRI